VLPVARPNSPNPVVAPTTGIRYYHFMKYRFSALITKENGWYVARCPELNVTSQGKNVEEARANLTEAMELYLETWGLPEQLPSDTESFWTTVEISQ